MVAPALLALALGTLGAIADIPKPLLHSWDTAVAGASFWVRCSLPQNASNNIRVRSVAQNHFGKPLTGTCSDWELYTPPKLCWYRVPEDEEGTLNVSCEAKLKPYNSQMEWKEIRVEAKPRLDPAFCPAQQNWIEGETQILDCRARGSPDPDLECTKDGISFPVRTPIRAERIHTGIYLCRAWNYLGSTDRNVTVLVQNSAPDSASSSLLPVVLGILLAVVALLVLTGLYWWHHHSTEDDKDWHRARRSRPPRHQGATMATKGVS